MSSSVYAALSDLEVLGPLRVGVPVPEDQPTSGGAYEFQHTIFAEICTRLKSRQRNSHIQYIPLASRSEHASAWHIPPNQVIELQSSLGLRVLSTLHRGATSFLKPWSSQSCDSSWQIRQLYRLIKPRVDVLWSLSPSILTTQIPFVLTVWDLQHRLQPFFPEVSRNGQWEDRQHHYAIAARKAFLSVVGTRRGAEELHTFFGVDQARVLVNAFPCPPPLVVSQESQERILALYALRPGSFLLYPAQFWSHKNHLCALLALRILKESGLSIKLVLTGSDMGCFDHVRRCASELGLGELVIFPGFVQRDVLAALYLSTLALIYPSFFGPDNIPPLEAMSYGVPSIVADVPGSYEQFGDAVLRFGPGNPEELATAVRRLVEDLTLQQRLISRGRQLVAQLSPSGYVDRVELALRSSSLALRCTSMV